MIKQSLRNLSLSAVLALFGTSSIWGAPPAKAFGELPIAFDGAISPDGKTVAAIVNNGGSYFVISKEIEGSGSKNWTLPVGEGIYPQWIRWVNNEVYVISITQQVEYAGIPFSQGLLFAGDAVNKEANIVISPKRMFRQFNNIVVDWLDNEPDHILMAFSDKENDSFPDLKKVNVRTGKTKTFMKRKDGIERWITDDEGQPIIGWGRSDGRGKERQIILDPEDSSWKDISKFPGLDYDTKIFGIINDGSQLVIGAYEGRDTLGVYVYDLAQRKIVERIFHDEDYDANGVVLSKDGEKVLGAKYTADTDKTKLLPQYDTAMEQIRKKFPEFDVRLIDQSGDGERLLVNITGPSEPGGLFLYNTGDPNPKQMSLMYSGLKSAEMGRVFSTSYKSSDGETIPSFITLPPSIASLSAAKNLPTIVLPHGGPYGRDSKRFDYFAQFFATRGYAVIQMNFRGSEGYGKAFKKAGRDNWLLMQEDVSYATNFMIANGYSDPKRTCIAGWSYGGYAALMGAAKDNSGKYNCVVGMAALTDIDDAKRDMEKYRGGKNAAKNFFGEAMNDAGLRKVNSPVNVAENIKVPVFLAHGDMDQNVQFDQFERMKRALEKAGVDGTYMAFKDEDHFLSRQANREAFFESLEKFLLRVNGPSEFMAK